jgi:transcriptional regulator with XRE-family HTH domain
MLNNKLTLILTPIQRFDMENKEYFLSVGKYIADRRRDKNLTQSNLCEVTGISQSTISGIEKGARLPSAKDMMLLSSTLHITPNDILSCGVVGYEFSKTKTDEECAKEDLAMLMKTTVSFFELSKQSKLLVSSHIFKLAEEENGIHHVELMNKIEAMSNEIVEIPELKETVLNIVNRDRESNGLDSLGESEKWLAIKSLLDIFLNGRN